MSLPSPRPGLVISYSYRWREHGEGAEEGHKHRPCAIVAARQVVERREIVNVLPVTHTAPANPLDAVEIPAALKAHLGLDELPSWIVNGFAAIVVAIDSYPSLARLRASLNQQAGESRWCGWILFEQGFCT